MTSTLTPLERGTRTTNVLYRWCAHGEEQLVKVYRGPRAREHCQCEGRMLRLWYEHGLAVPAVRELLHPHLEGRPHLILEWLPGRNLSQALRGPGRIEDKQALVRRVFAANRNRDELALERRDVRLTHPDLNSRNLLVDDAAGPWFIDLESVPTEREPEEAIAMELAKLCRWMACDLGRGHLDFVVRALVECYAGHDGLLRRIVDRTYRRSFQFFHRWRDRRFKAEQPDEVTKYDVADCLQGLLRRAA
jgi:Ser/Thr protein kinase RdoA (MazF antagonist)